MDIPKQPNFVRHSEKYRWLRLFHCSLLVNTLRLLQPSAWLSGKCFMESIVASGKHLIYLSFFFYVVEIVRCLVRFYILFLMLPLCIISNERGQPLTLTCIVVCERIVNPHFALHNCAYCFCTLSTSWTWKPPNWSLIAA